MMPIPALASNGLLTSRVVTVNGAGADATARLEFIGKRTLIYENLYINDRCDSDGKDDDRVTRLKFWIKRDGVWHDMGMRPDAGGCKSAPYRGSYWWQGAIPFVAAGFQVCAGKTCDPVIHYRVNHFVKR